MNNTNKSLVFKGFLVVATIIIGGSFLVPTASANGDSIECVPNPGYHLTYQPITVSFNTAQAGFTNSSSKCSYKVGLATYKTYSLPEAGWHDYIYTQTLFDTDFKIVGPGQTVTLSADVPNCNYQADLFQGTYAPVPPDFGAFGDLKLFTWKQTFDMGVCTNTPPPVPTVDIKANNSNGPITIPYNTGATISWTSANATSCTVSPSAWTGTSGSNPSGSLTSSRTYTATCTGAGGTATDSVTVNVEAAPQVPTVDIKANGSNGPITIPYNTGATISWTSANATSCTVSPSGWTGTSGSNPSGSLTNSRTYTATCTGAGGSATDSVTVNVESAPQAPTVDIKANASDGPITVSYNSGATINWTSQNATACTVSPSGWTGISGASWSGSLTNSRTYTATCTGAGGSATDSVVVNVEGVPTPTVDIKANGSNGPITIPYNTGATISWTSANVTACTVMPSGWTGISASNWSGSLTSSRTYTATCTGVGGTATDSVTVNVESAPAPTVDIKANNSNGPITISYNTGATISWTSANVTACTVTPSGWTGTFGSQNSDALTSSRTYTINCTGQGGSATDSVTVNVESAPQAPTVDIKANGLDGPITIGYNTGATISWTSANASACSVSPHGWVGTSGSQGTGLLTASRTYTATCTGVGGSATDSVTVNVESAPTPQAPTVDIKANGSDGPVAISYNTAATISWTSQNATACTVSPSGWTGTSGTNQTGNLIYSKLYSIVCSGPGGSASDSVSVTISSVPAPTVNIKANGQDGPITIAYNAEATISWTSANTDTCSVYPTGWTGLTGSQGTGPLTFQKSYHVTCYGPGGVATDLVTVLVTVNDPTVDIKANGSDGPVTIAYNAGATVSWTSQDATSCNVSPSGWTGITGSQGSGNLTITKTYFITCSGPGGLASDSVTINVSAPPQAPTATIKANGSDFAVTVPYNTPATLTWSSQNADSCTVTPGSMTGTSGSASTGNLTSSQTYLLNCTGTGGSATDSITVNVTSQPAAPTADIKANGSDSTITVPYQSNVSITWSSQNANSCTVSPTSAGGTFGSESQTLTGSRTYTIQCTGTGGSASDSVTVNVNQPLLPSVQLNASPRTINSGQTSYLSWNSSNADSCSVSGGWSGNKFTNGSENVSPTFTTTYTITCVNNYGVAQDTETVSVTTVNNPTSLFITKSGFNQTLGQTASTNSFEGQSGDTLIFEIRVRNTDSNGGVITVRDVLPVELTYVPGTTRVNGVIVADGIVSQGISLGFVQSNEEKIVRFETRVLAGITPRTIVNVASASMNAGIQTSSVTITIRNRGQILGAADIVTGPEDVLPWVFSIGLIGSLISYWWFFKRNEEAALGVVPMASKSKRQREFERLVQSLK